MPQGGHHPNFPYNLPLWSGSLGYILANFPIDASKFLVFEVIEGGKVRAVANARSLQYRYDDETRRMVADSRLDGKVAQFVELSGLSLVADSYTRIDSLEPSDIQYLVNQQ